MEASSIKSLLVYKVSCRALFGKSIVKHGVSKLLYKKEVPSSMSLLFAVTITSFLACMHIIIHIHPNSEDNILTIFFVCIVFSHILTSNYCCVIFIYY